MCVCVVEHSIDDPDILCKYICKCVNLYVYVYICMSAYVYRYFCMCVYVYM